MHPRLDHFLYRPLFIARLQIDGPRPVQNQPRLKPELPCIQRGELHAVVRRQTENMHPANPRLPQPPGKLRFLPMMVIEKPAVAVDPRVGPFPNHRVNPCRLQPLHKPRPVRILHAMHRPDHLRHPIDLDVFPDTPPRILRNERHVVPRMPVLRRNDEIPFRPEPRDPPVCHRHHGMPIRNRQRASRNKVILNIDQNQRSFRHRFGDDTIRNSMADQPIIHSLLDVDFYKDTMGQMIFHRHPAVPVKLEFRNRHTHVRLAERIDLAKLRENLQHLRGLQFTPQELDFLRSIRSSSRPMFQPDYIQFLHTLRLPEFHLDVRDGQLALEFFGPWTSVSRWETLALQVVSELYGEFQSRDINLDEGNLRLDEKIEMLKRNPRITFSDFGSRRRWSRKWQEHVVARLAEELPVQFRGTCNSHLSMKYDLAHGNQRARTPHGVQRDLPR